MSQLSLQAQAGPVQLALCPLHTHYTGLRCFDRQLLLRTVLLRARGDRDDAVGTERRRSRARGGACGDIPQYPSPPPCLIRGTFQ